MREGTDSTRLGEIEPELDGHRHCSRGNQSHEEQTGRGATNSFSVSWQGSLAFNTLEYKSEPFVANAEITSSR